jgi:hypothetical protein
MLSIELLFKQHHEALDRAGHVNFGTLRPSDDRFIISLREKLIKAYEDTKLTKSPISFCLKNQALFNNDKDDFKIMYNLRYDPKAHDLALTNLYAVFNDVSSSFYLKGLHTLPSFESVFNQSQDNYLLHPQRKIDALKSSMAEEQTTLIELGYYHQPYYQFDTPENDALKLNQAFKDALYNNLGSNAPMDFVIQNTGKSGKGESSMVITHHYQYNPLTITLKHTCITAQTEVKQIYYIRNKVDIPPFESIRKQHLRESQLLKQNEAFIKSPLPRGIKR